MSGSGIVLAGPIRVDGEEEWRRFWQELAGSRRKEYEELRRRLGITGQRVWLLRTGRGELAVTSMDCTEPGRVLDRLAVSSAPFDRWFRERLADFHGCDFDRPTPRCSSELVFEA